MFLREWLRPPRAVLALFLVVTLVPAAGLVWLGWYLLQQDRALVDQRVQERRERAADLLVGTLDAKLRAFEQDLTGPSARQLLAQGDDAVLVVLGSGAMDVYPRSHLLYYPIASPCQEPAELVFRAGEDREFRLHDYAGAIANFRELSRSEDATVRAGGAASHRAQPAQGRSDGPGVGRLSGPRAVRGRANWLCPGESAGPPRPLRPACRAEANRGTAP